ncbi:Multiple antibiotic resistance protein marR [Corynebacterium pseudotuberculosis]|nr:Multiple antibiotic resistance protein marR [Corynebacterium pseudotuberculosis 3/99-5]AIG06274.1 Transcriptional regulator, MarR family [Corynebacterium pseudotuberculosis]AIG09140.1 Transcriptional regulator, MarR family [Corynebacterium pseudotuberculosis]AIG11040.1 Transcriptional regulator, MarR family [Corynebacterium pseudotuberculosis]AKP09622.1 Multiple antibiotic resistance protein marR [Corynebacterium pseudotuberculosis]
MLFMTSQTPYELAEKIRPALTQLYVLYFRVAEQSDLTQPQLTIMTRLANTGPARISHIAQAEGIRMPTASNALHHLEKRGIVERIRDESDRRGVKVQLTDFGQAELLRVGEERTQYLADMLATLPPEEYAQMDKVADVINKLSTTYTSSMLENEKD